MASAEHVAPRPKGDFNENNTSSIAITCVEDALKALTVQNDTEKVSSDILQHANGNRCTQTTADNAGTQIISSNFEETNLSKNSEENITEGKEVSGKTAAERENDVIRSQKYNAIAGEKENSDVNECGGLYESSKLKEIGNQNSNCIQVENTEKELLDEELKLLQCPFTWNLNFKNIRRTTERVIAKCNDKLTVLEEENDGDDGEELFEWGRFILTLILCHEHYINGSSSEALSKLQECEHLINKCQSSEKSDTFFQNVKEALLYVVNATKCHLLVSLNMFNDAIKLRHDVPRYEDMDSKNLAAMFGIQSAMLMEYGYEGTKAALGYAEKAVSLDGNETEWHFLYGKILGRIRRVENFTGIPTQQELSALEQAVRTTKNASRIVFLAEACRKAAFIPFIGTSRINRHSLKAILTKMNEKSLQLYWEALKLNGHNARVNIRCAEGLLKLPRRFQDLRKAEECIKKALKLVPNNPMANHVAGNLYERLSKFDLAEKFYKKSAELGIYWAYMNLLTMKIKKDRKYDPLAELQEMLQQFTLVAEIQETYLHMGSYLFFFKNDIFAALDYWMKGIELDPNAGTLKAHTFSFLVMMPPVNLYQVIVDEIRLALKQNTLTDKNNLELRKILRYCTERNPELLTNMPQSWRQHSLKEQNIQGRRRNQNNDRKAGQGSRNKHPEQWRSETREEGRYNYGRTYRGNSSTTRGHDKDHSQCQLHENWRRSKKQNNDRETGQGSRNKHPEQWRSDTREEGGCNYGRTYRDNSSTIRDHGYRNKDHSQYQVHENWGRRKNQNNDREAGQGSRNKHPEQWRSDTREEGGCNYGRTYRDNSSTIRGHGYRNKDHSQYQVHENWRRRKNQNNDRKAGQGSRNKHPEQWRSDTREKGGCNYGRSSRDVNKYN